MIGILLGSVAVALSLPSALCFIRNLRHYLPLPEPAEPPGPVSVLIPARNEESHIGAALTSVLHDPGTEVEVLVLDDHSTDATRDIVRAIQERDPRVRLIDAPPLPEGWCGKQHACYTLAKEARHDHWLFVDADVRLQPRSCGRISAFLDRSGAGLVSGIPRQEVRSLLERLLVPLIHFMLLAFLPVRRMRRSRRAAFAAACGQLIAVRRHDYWKAGGHASIRESLHDGLKLPRAFRQAGLHTDLFDATREASCRMYQRAGEVWSGLAKNATEGLAAPGLIVPATLGLLAGHVLPFVLLGAAPLLQPPAIALAAAACVLSLTPRVLAALWFRQPLGAALLHPLAVILLLLIQWQAFALRALGRSTSWRGRRYTGAVRPVPKPPRVHSTCGAPGRVP